MGLASVAQEWCDSAEVVGAILAVRMGLLATDR